MTEVLVGTNVLIDYLRDVPEAVTWLESAPGPLALSSLTVAELHAGARTREEREAIRELTGAFHVVAADEAICERAGELRARYGPSHGMDLIDGVIAATSLLRQLPLATLNKKHFPMLQNVIVPYRGRPH